MQKFSNVYCSDVKKMFWFAVIKSVAAIALKNINNARAMFYRKHIFGMKIVVNF